MRGSLYIPQQRAKFDVEFLPTGIILDMCSSTYPSRGPVPLTNYALAAGRIALSSLFLPEKISAYPPDFLSEAYYHGGRTGIPATAKHSPLSFL